MTAAQKLQPISVEDYLAGELQSRRKNEYVGGRIYAMAGARVVHNVIATNIVGSIHASLKGKRCRAFNSDMKIRIPSPPVERFFYPDASVVCDSNPPTNSFQERPVVVFEVISQQTRRADEGEKQDAYLSLPSLACYVLVEQDVAVVRVYRRTGDRFVEELYEGLAGSIALAEVGISLLMADIYEGVEFVPEEIPE